MEVSHYMRFIPRSSPALLHWNPSHPLQPFLSLTMCSYDSETKTEKSF